MISPVPRYGDVVVGRDTRGRVLRIGSHPERNRVVLSIWQDGICLATVRLAGEDLPEVLRSLGQSLVDLDEASLGDQLRTVTSSMSTARAAVAVDDRT